jgi:hypothetical protein
MGGGGGGKGMTASEARSGRHGERWRGGFPTGVGRCGGEDGADKRVPHVSGGKREGAESGRRESKEKAHYRNYANGACGLSGLGRPVGFGLWERRGQRGPAGPRPSGPHGRPGRKQGKKNF